MQGWGGGVNSPQAGYSKLPLVDDTISGVRLSAKRDLSLGPITAVEGGVPGFDSPQPVRATRLNEINGLGAEVGKLV